MIEKTKIFLSKASSFFSLDFLIDASREKLFFPFYHVVSDEHLPHIKHLYPIVSSRKFEADLDFLLKHFKPLSIDDLIQNTASGKEIDENGFFLSFDDGLREFHDIVAPILLRKGIPAACFVNTAFIDNKDMLFRMKASILIETINKKKLTSIQQKNIADVFSERNLLYKQELDLLKVSYTNQDMLPRIAKIIDVDFDDFLKTQRPYLSSTEINDLIKKGFSIGSHSVSHPYYCDLDENRQIQQTLDSLRYLKENFDINEGLFAFPFTDYGVKQSFFDRIASEIDLSFGTASIKIDPLRTHFQRTTMEKAGYRNTENYVKSEYTLFLLKKLLGKHVIIRK